MTQGKLYEKIHKIEVFNPAIHHGTIMDRNWKEMREVLDEAKQDYPKVSQKEIGHLGYQKALEMMEHKIIEFENFGKKWFGEASTV